MSDLPFSILLIDDSPSDLMLIQRAFKNCGIVEGIYTLSNGFEAIRYLMGEGVYSDRIKYPYPSLIISDLKMLNGDGLSILEHLKRNPAWAIIPTIIFSGSGDNDDIRSSYMMGAASYIQKPNDFEKMRSIIKTIADYWKNCSLPDVDKSGKQIRTDTEGKIGERFPQPFQIDQSRIEIKTVIGG